MVLETWNTAVAWAVFSSFYFTLDHHFRSLNWKSKDWSGTLTSTWEIVIGSSLTHFRSKLCIILCITINNSISANLFPTHILGQKLNCLTAWGQMLFSILLSIHLSGMNLSQSLNCSRNSIGLQPTFVFFGICKVSILGVWFHYDKKLTKLV